MENSAEAQWLLCQIERLVWNRFVKDERRCLLSNCCDINSNLELPYTVREWMKLELLLFEERITSKPEMEFTYAIYSFMLKQKFNTFPWLPVLLMASRRNTSEDFRCIFPFATASVVLMGSKNISADIHAPYSDRILLYVFARNLAFMEEREICSHINRPFIVHECKRICVS